VGAAAVDLISRAPWNADCDEQSAEGPKDDAGGVALSLLMPAGLDAALDRLVAESFGA
jgi:hypothetical protein